MFSLLISMPCMLEVVVSFLNGRKENERTLPVNNSLGTQKGNGDDAINHRD